MLARSPHQSALRQRPMKCPNVYSSKTELPGDLSSNKGAVQAISCQIICAGNLLVTTEAATLYHECWHQIASHSSIFNWKRMKHNQWFHFKGHYQCLLKIYQEKFISIHMLLLKNVQVSLKKNVQVSLLYL